MATEYPIVSYVGLKPLFFSKIELQRGPRLSPTA
jgi:hypothetical protein